MGEPFVKVNWMSGFDERGRPMQTPQPAGQPTYPGNQGGTNWYSPVVQPAHRPVLRLGLGRLRERLFASAVGVQGRVEFRRRWSAELVGGAWRARPRPIADQHVDRSRRSWRGDRARSQDGTREVEVQDDRRHRQRHPDDRRRTCCSPAGVKASSRRWTRARARCCGRRISEPRSTAARSPIASARGSTSRSCPGSRCSCSRSTNRSLNIPGPLGRVREPCSRPARPAASDSRWLRAAARDAPRTARTGPERTRACGRSPDWCTGTTSAGWSATPRSRPFRRGSVPRACPATSAECRAGSCRR